MDEYLFFFGDGLYEVGNTTNIINPDKYLRTYHAPYGTNFFNHSATGRYSDGRIVPDFVAEKVGLKFIASFQSEDDPYFTNGASFASEGATALVNFTGQVELFKEVKEIWREHIKNDTEVYRRLHKAVYFISIGAQDYINCAASARRISEPTFVDRVVNSISDAIKNLYDLGAWTFAVQNVVKLGSIPYVRQIFNDGKPFREMLSIMAQAHKGVLPGKPEAIKKNTDKYPEFEYTVFDFYTAIDTMIDVPQDYGFKVVDIACCGNSTYRGQACGSLDYEFCVCGNKTEYLFFDGTHNTDAANGQLAELMWDKKYGFVSPYGVKDFFLNTIAIQTLLTEAAASG
ncbi:hypothetical protein GH714_036549 [Hevea brasiliensis]|uniref:Uncharacterized protein n=1 Tax=Hevea brasiliensis TaxID=3981 RepID=A0A6A6NEV7_HEVBR|nr:hypothetical protein GH714_036542 [Hevea brasiliensis]KAF2323668.1 hypothetical protein GH714_036549 [Hevea brasiliensis]